MNEAIQKHDRQGLEVLGDTEEMGRRLALNSERIGIVHKFVDDNFREGIDFGPADPRNPKPTLLKPGAERICKLFNTRATWRMDEDTWRMLGEPKGVVCYLCEIVDNTTGEVVGEGRGAEKVGNKARDANKAIKAAEKCSIVDAALYTFGLSERFTQDGGAGKKDLDAAKSELTAIVEDVRAGIESELSNNRFIHSVIKDFTHGTSLQTIGAVNAVMKAITDERYDLATGERTDAQPPKESTGSERDLYAELSRLAKVKWGADWFDDLESFCDGLKIDFAKASNEDLTRATGVLSGQLREPK